MNKNKALFVTMTGAAVLAGFIVGYGIGQETRKATPSNVDTDFNNGVVTITANVTGALKGGISTWLGSL